MLQSKPGKGLEADLHQYQPCRNSVGDSLLDAPAVIRIGGLKRFLADAKLDASGSSALFSLVPEGSEVLASSRPLSGNHDVPVSELDALQSAVDEHLTKKRDSLPPKSEGLLDALQLPDPFQSPEMYRLYGPRWNKRLAIVWGCEQEPGSSLPLQKAVDKLRLRAIPIWKTYIERFMWAALLLLALVAIGLILWVNPWRNSLSATPGNTRPHSDGPLDPKQKDPPQAPQILTTQTIAKQYLSFRLVNPNENTIPNQVEAWASQPGTITWESVKPSVEVTRKTTGIDQRVVFEVPTVGRYRIEWEPESPKLNGEFAELEFTELQVQLPHVVPRNPSDPSRLVPTVPSVPRDSRPSDPKDPSLLLPKDPSLPVPKVPSPGDSNPTVPQVAPNVIIQKVSHGIGKVVLRVETVGNGKLPLKNIEWMVDGKVQSEKSEQFTLMFGEKKTVSVKVGADVGNTRKSYQVRVTTTTTVELEPQ